MTKLIIKRKKYITYRYNIFGLVLFKNIHVKIDNNYLINKIMNFGILFLDS